MSSQGIRPFQEMLSAELARNDDWLSVLAHFEYHEGFAFGLLLLVNEALLPVCRSELERFLKASGRGMVDLSVPTPDEFVEVCLSLRDREVNEDAGAVWISAVVSEHDSSYAEWRGAFQTAFARLNPLRNALQQHLKTTLIFVCAPWTQSIIRNMAPDLWSVRSVVTSIQVATPASGVGVQRMQSSVEYSPESAPDPLFALREAEPLRGVAGQELALARLLFRAGLGLIERQQLEAAAEAVRECLDLRERFSAPAVEIADTHTALARALRGLGRLEEAVSHFRNALSLLDRTLDWKMYAQNLRDLSDVLSSWGRRTEVLSLLREALDLSEKHENPVASVDIRAQLGSALFESGDLSGSRFQEEAVLEGRMRLLGAENIATLAAMNNLAITLREQGDLSGARSLSEQALQGYRSQLGEDHPDTIRAMENYAGVLLKLGDASSARKLQERVLEGYRSRFGEEDFLTLRAMGNLAATITSDDELSTVRALEEKVLNGLRALLGEDDPNTLRAMGNLAQTVRADGDVAGSRSLLESALEISRRTLGESHPETLRFMSGLARIVGEDEHSGEARVLYEEVLEAQRRVLGNQHPATLATQHNLAVCLLREGDWGRARELAEATAEGSAATFGPVHPETLESERFLADVLERSGDPQGAAELRKKVDAQEHSASPGS